MDLLSIVQRHGLSDRAHEEAARWTDALVELGYLRHQPKSLGDSRPEIPGTSWDQGQVSRYHDYRLTSTGREEAERIRRRAREIGTDAALGSRLPALCQPWMTDSQTRAIAVPLAQLVAALKDRDDYVATVFEHTPILCRHDRPAATTPPEWRRAWSFRRIAA